MNQIALLSYGERRHRSGSRNAWAGESDWFANMHPRIADTLDTTVSKVP